MKLMVIVKANEQSEAGEMPSREMLSAMGEYNEELVKAGIMKDGDGLRPSSAGTRMTFSGGKTSVTDGPFAETKELVAGYWVWELESRQEAIEWARKAPFDSGEGETVLEIREFAQAEDFGEEFTPELREQEERLRAEAESQSH